MRVWEGPGPVPPDVLRDEVGPVHGLLTMLTDLVDVSLLDKAPNLKVVSQMAVGVDNIDVGECHRRGIAVGHTPDVLTDTVADTAFALLASIVRRLPEGAAEVKTGGWGPWDPFHMTGGDLHGTVLGIVGMGRIGSALARRARGFNIKVIYTSRDSVSDLGERVELTELLVRADHVVVTAALTSETRGLIGINELSLMKETAYLVNVSRGPIVDTDALCEALVAGEIAGAGLDVTDPEPLPSGHRLLSIENCLVVPHIGSASVRTRTAMANLAVTNLVAGLAARPMPNAVPAGD